MSSRQHEPSEVGAPLPTAAVPPTYGYIAAFLTLRCGLGCPYCITEFGESRPPRPEMPAADWMAGLNRIESTPDLPVTLQGGEPSLHPGFLEIVAGIKPSLRIDLLTNLQFDVEPFMRAAPPQRWTRPAPYASIRVSYHPFSMDLDAMKKKVLRLLENGYPVGVWAVAHPDAADRIEAARRQCRDAGIDFRVKEFLGTHAGELRGTYRYPEALAGHPRAEVLCRTTELIIAPDGAVHRCHSDLYAGRQSVGHLLDPAFRIEDGERPCQVFGLCNPCDVKVKTNRFQESGHTSVSIRPAGRGSLSES